MGARGPLPQTAALRLLRGNPGKRTTASHVVAPRGVPTCPTWLSREAKAEWRRVVGTLEASVALSPVDRGVVAAYCHWWGVWLLLAQEIAKAENLTAPGDRDRRTIKKHPLWQEHRDASVQVTALAKELGLTPSARLRLKAPERDPKTASELD